MAASAGDSHPYPIYNARYRMVFPILDADGDLVSGAASLDSELSQDQGTFADATNEATEIATSSGVYYLDLIATELDTKSTAVIVKTATAGAKTTPMVLYPKRLPAIRTGTAQAGAATTITLDSGASAVDNYYNGCYVNITNNSPANALGQARLIVGYVGSTKVATVEAAWGTNPSSASTFEILAPETVNVVAWAGTAVADPNTVGYPVGTVKDGTGTGEIDTTSGGVLVAAIAANAITATAIATDAITAAKIAPDAIGASELAADAVTEIQSGLATSAALATVQADTDDIQTRLPAALVSGRMDSSVGAVAANAITAAAVADGAIDRATFAADTGLQSIRSNTAQAGGATSITLDASASATTDFYKGTWILLTGNTGVGQVRLCTAYDGTTKVATVAPAWATNPDVTTTFAILAAAGVDVELWAASAPNVLVSGRIDASVGAMAANVLTATAIATDAITAAKIAPDAIGASELAADAVTEIQSGLATAAALATVQADTDDIQTRLPAALVSGRIDASVGAMAANTVTAAAVATGAVDADALATDAVAEIADGILDRNLATGVDSGTEIIRTVRQAFRALRNRFNISGTTRQVFKEDDTTVSWQSTVQTNASADPVVGDDPFSS